MEVPPVVEAMVKSGVFAGVVTELLIERSEYGVVVPMPTLPPDTGEEDWVSELYIPVA